MDEPGSPPRKRAVLLFGMMLGVWTGLYFLSFNGQRGQVQPEDYSFAGMTSVQGKKVFQGYACMGCHTIVGNGGYFAPDLTNIFETAGPAWLAAFIPSAGMWPTEAILNLQINQMHKNGLIEQDSLESYYKAYPGARERIEIRGGLHTAMPNLAFEQQDVNALIAFLHYASDLKTEGWPPQVRANPHIIERETQALRERAGIVSSTPAAPAVAATVAAPAAGEASADASEADPVAQGEALAASQGCLACHDVGTARKVGPGWGGIAGTEQKQADGSMRTVDADYLKQSILDPNASVVDGFPAGVMPSYEGMLDEAQVAALVAYIQHLTADEVK